MRRTSCVLLLALAVTAAAAGGASARCARSNPGGVLGGRVGVLPAPLKADVVVDQRGGGDVTTIADALGRSNGTRGPTGYFVIHIREGVYDEHIVVPTANVVFMGDGREKTILTGSRSNKTGHNVHESATLTAQMAGFMARDLCVRNTAGGPEDGQAVALFSDSEHSVFYRCDIQGFQDTVLANTQQQFYLDCRIWGTVDFIFGNAAAVFQNCTLYARQPADPRKHDVITAQGREEHSGHHSGFVFQSCVVTSSALPGESLNAGVQTFLGRPWRNHALVVFIRCSVDPIVHADGWVTWSKDRRYGGKDPAKGHENHTVFAEYDNHVLGSVDNAAVHWRGFTEISLHDAIRYTARHFIRADDWIPQTGVPYRCGL